MARLAFKPISVARFAGLVGSGVRTRLRPGYHSARYRGSLSSYSLRGDPKLWSVRNVVARCIALT
jgi:hypothetical protein